MPRLALGLYVLYLALAVGWRSWRQFRDTGHTGFVGAHAGAVPRPVGALLVAAIALGLVSPLAALREGRPEVVGAQAAAGIALFAAGLALTLWAQLHMGASWRTGVAFGLALQVRLVEEPYLLRTHGEVYRDWAARTGRFLPGVGRLR